MKKPLAKACSDRRAFLKLLGILSTYPTVGISSVLAKSGEKKNLQSGTSLSKEGDSNLVISAFDDYSGQHFIGVYDESQSRWLARVAVSQRYHACACMGSEDQYQLIFVARRPGNQAILLNLANQRVIELTATAGRHFFGHAAIDRHGTVWFTENDYQNNRGLLVGRAGKQLEHQVASIDLGGLGPHELTFLSDGVTAVVGLGGIETHPDFPRKKLNLDTMQSELLLVDTATRMVVNRATPPDPQLSLRHLDRSERDQIVIAAQYQGPNYEQFPLVYSYDSESGLQAMDAPEQVWRSMNQYIASVQIHSSNNEVLVTCPRSNAVHRFSLNTLVWLDTYKLADPGGVCLDSQGNYLVSSGTGKIVCLSSNNGRLTLERESRVGDTRWDNHMDRVVFAKA